MCFFPRGFFYWLAQDHLLSSCLNWFFWAFPVHDWITPSQDIHPSNLGLLTLTLGDFRWLSRIALSGDALDWIWNLLHTKCIPYQYALSPPKHYNALNHCSTWDGSISKHSCLQFKGNGETHAPFITPFYGFLPHYAARRIHNMTQKYGSVFYWLKKRPLASSLLSFLWEMVRPTLHEPFPLHFFHDKCNCLCLIHSGNLN